MKIERKNQYDASNRLKLMEHPDGPIVEFTYDNNGNMVKKIPVSTTTVKKSIADGNPIEWTYNRNTYIADNRKDFINTGLDTQEPERDIQGVYYNTDSTYLYVMIELGRTKEHDLLNPHGYDNDNYFIYLSSPQVGSNFTRNNTLCQGKYPLRSAVGTITMLLYIPMTRQQICGSGSGVATTPTTAINLSRF